MVLLDVLAKYRRKMHNSERPVPLFEYINLINTHTAADLEKYMSDLDTAIQEIHRTFAIAP